MEINKTKNRYANVIAYDHSRVVLQNPLGVQGGDYVNGNFCDGYCLRNAYIATQGPLPDTIQGQLHSRGRVDEILKSGVNFSHVTNR